jgi:hypothetical protein
MSLLPEIEGIHYQIPRLAFLAPSGKERFSVATLPSGRISSEIATSTLCVETSSGFCTRRSRIG